MAGGVGMDRFRAEPIGGTILELLLIQSMGLDMTGDVVLFRKLCYDVPVSRQSLEHSTAVAACFRISADVKGINEYDSGLGMFLCEMENLGVEALVGRWGEIDSVAQIAMQIIDSDLDRQPVRLVDEHIIMPASAKILNGVSTDTFVDKSNVTLRILRSDEVDRLFDVSTAEWALWTATSAVSNTVTDHHHSLPAFYLETHGTLEMDQYWI